MATVTEESVDLPTPTGTMRVHLYRPSGEPGAARVPGLVLYSEIYQQTPPIRRSALRFASEGFLVAVPEIFHAHEPPGTVLAHCTDQVTPPGATSFAITALTGAAFVLVNAVGGD